MASIFGQKTDTKIASIFGHKNCLFFWTQKWPLFLGKKQTQILPLFLDTSVFRCCGHAASASRVCGFPYYHLGYLKKYKFWKATFLLTTGTRSGMGGQTKHKCGQGP
jgi:hypothetical protein